jgi:TonB family protein
MLLPRRIVVSLLFPLIFPIFSRSQGPIAPSTSLSESVRAYQNSPDGLRWQLQDILNAARDPNRLRLESLIRQTEIPNSKEWFASTFGRENGDIWALAYEVNLSENEKNFEEVLTQLAGEDGEFLTRKVNDGPAPARKIEASMVNALQRPVDIFFASWKKRGFPQDSKSTAVGYFVFLEGSFRLDSAISSLELQPELSKDDPVPQAATTARLAGGPNNSSARGMDNGVSRPGVSGVGYPSCDYCPDPEYTKLARKKKLQGTVSLRAIIQADGGVTDIQVVKSPSPELTEMAVDGVSKWHMNPARRADGEPVPVIVPIEITFRLLK